MQANAAKKCFGENITLFANAQTAPEKFNLYNGLYNLADAVEQIERRLTAIENAVNQLGAQLQQRR